MSFHVCLTVYIALGELYSVIVFTLFARVHLILWCIFLAHDYKIFCYQNTVAGVSFVLLFTNYDGN